MCSTQFWSIPCTQMLSCHKVISSMLYAGMDELNSPPITVWFSLDLLSDHAASDANENLVKSSQRSAQVWDGWTGECRAREICLILRVNLVHLCNAKYAAEKSCIRMFYPFLLRLALPEHGKTSDEQASVFLGDLTSIQPQNISKMILLENLFLYLDYESRITFAHDRDCECHRSAWTLVISVHTTYIYIFV